MIPIALSGGTVMGVFLMTVIVLGYVVIWALWHFVFREAGDHVTGERPATVPPQPRDSWSQEPPSPADRSRDGSARTRPQPTPRAAQAPRRTIGDGQASTRPGAGNDPPEDGPEVPRVASGEEDRQA